MHENIDYFNEQERLKQKKFALIRDKLLHPIIKWLAAKGVTPAALSFQGVIFLLMALLAGPGLGIFAGFFLCLYIIVDGIDGPLARYLDMTSTRGSIIDIISDQLGVFLIPVAASYYGLMNSTFLLLFAGGYIFVILLMTALNYFKINYLPILRIKYVMFGAYVMALFGFSNLFSLLVTIFAIYYVTIMLYLYFKLCFGDSIN